MNLPLLPPQNPETLVEYFDQPDPNNLVYPPDYLHPHDGYIPTTAREYPTMEVSEADTFFVFLNGHDETERTKIEERIREQFVFPLTTKIADINPTEAIIAAVDLHNRGFRIVKSVMLYDGGVNRTIANAITADMDGSQEAITDWLLKGAVIGPRLHIEAGSKPEYHAGVALWMGGKLLEKTIGRHQLGYFKV